MDDSQFGGAVPALSALRIPSRSYPAVGDVDGDGKAGFDFRNFQDGVYDLVEAGADLSGTAFAVPLQPGLAGPGQPRLVDIFPIFYFGVPNAVPYQLATGKAGGPLSPGKPFIHNFLPITQTADGKLYGGDMLRLNMATPVTDRDSDEFRDYARQGLVRAAALGLTAPPYNTSTDLEFIPHMDGFPNGRRLQDDVTTIELQAVGGLVLAAVGLPFDDATAADYSDLASPRLVAELTYNAGPTANDVPLMPGFPYLATPHRGYDYVKQLTAQAPASGSSASVGLSTGTQGSFLGLAAPEGITLEQNYPNPFNPSTTITYRVTQQGPVAVRVFDLQGRLVKTLVDREQSVGAHSVQWDASDLASGTYFYRIEAGGRVLATRRAQLVK
jgi:hypothetical protein